MTMHTTIADYLRVQDVPPENFKFVDPAEITVRTKRPIWTWVCRVAHEIPKGKCVLLPVPDGYTIDRFINNLRSSLTVSKTTRYDKFSIRRSKMEDYAVIMKTGTWDDHYRWMENEQ